MSDKDSPSKQNAVPERRITTTGESAGNEQVVVKKRGGFIAWLALLTALAGIVGGYYLYQQRIQPLESLPDSIAEGQKRTAEQLAQQAALLEGFAKTLELQQTTNALDEQRFHALEQNLDTLRGQAFWTSREWRLAEIRYLIQVAEDRLQLMQDRATAMRALEAALGRLAELSDPTLEPLRQRLQHDLQRLAIPPGQDPVEVITKLEKQLAGISAYPRDPDPAAGTGGKPESGTTDSDTGKPTSLKALQSLLAGRIRIVHHDRPLDALEGGRVAAHQLELLKMRLLALRLALAQNNRQFYEHELKGIELWLQLNQLGEQGKEIIAELQRLSALDPFAPKPSLQPTLDLVSTLLSAGQPVLNGPPS